MYLPRLNERDIPVFPPQPLPTPEVKFGCRACEAANLHVPRQDLLRSARVHVPAFTEKLLGLVTGVDHVDWLTEEVCVDDVTCVGAYSPVSVTQNIGGVYNI